MKSIVGKSVTVVLLLAVASGLAAWLVFGDKISAALSGEPQTVSPLTAPVERGSVQQTVTGVGEEAAGNREAQACGQLALAAIVRRAA